MKSFPYKMTRLHGQLEEEIWRELKRRTPDNLRLLRLNKVRLHVKDRLYGHVFQARRVYHTATIHGGYALPRLLHGTDNVRTPRHRNRLLRGGYMV
ncbi:DUF465 domain-containing protein (plasmid) [Sphingobium sp. Cam5-1]|nr:DUF465 domain-containing protein [Sphingobium sp. Cam5-1]